MSVMYLPKRMKPKAIWNIPASMTTVNAIARPFSGFAAISELTTAVITTVIGPVGSDIRVEVPPNNAANRPIRIAPYSPASAPAPEATPKVRAKGNETTAAVTPPKRSPRALLRSSLLSASISFYYPDIRYRRECVGGRAQNRTWLSVHASADPTEPTPMRSRYAGSAADG